MTTSWPAGRGESTQDHRYQPSGVTRRHALELIGAASMVGLAANPVGATAANDVRVRLARQYNYHPDGDSVSGPLTGTRSWEAVLENVPDGSGEALRTPYLALDAPYDFSEYRHDGLVVEGPPTYRWDYGDVPAGASVDTHAGWRPDDPDAETVTFDPGVDITYTVDRVEFAEPGVQTIDIHVEGREATDSIGIYIGHGRLGDTTVTLVLAEGAQDVHEYEEHIQMHVGPIAAGAVFNITVVLEVTPAGTPVRIAPWTEFQCGPPVTETPDERIVGTDGVHAGTDVTWRWGSPDETSWLVYADHGQSIIWDGFAEHIVENEPPVIESVTATPDTLWPPNGRTRDVTIDVDAFDPDVDDLRVAFAVRDEYGELDTTLALLPDGGRIPLVAARNGDDLDGRTYEVEVFVVDEHDALDSATVEIVVPHDAREKARADGPHAT